jgi:hypothetical protein
MTKGKKDPDIWRAWGAKGERGSLKYHMLYQVSKVSLAVINGSLQKRNPAKSHS